jgi:hypothetical protein
MFYIKENTMMFHVNKKYFILDLSRDQQAINYLLNKNSNPVFVCSLLLLDEIILNMSEKDRIL